MGKDGYSRKGYFGETIHYDKKGRKIGESRPNFLGGVDHFDASGKKTGHSQKDFLGNVNHYDKNGHKTGYSRQGFLGQTNHYDNKGRKIGESAPTSWDGSQQHRIESSHSRSVIIDEFDEIEYEMLDECLDSEEAAEWLEDNGYDPDDFDL
jgi:hypothetical protein